MPDWAVIYCCMYRPPAYAEIPPDISVNRNHIILYCVLSGRDCKGAFLWGKKDKEVLNVNMNEQPLRRYHPP